MDNKVLVIGGLGFIGYHLVNTLEGSGYNVVIGSRREQTIVNHKVLFLDLEKMDDTELQKKLDPFKIIVFAGGVDDRNIPSGNAADYFYNGNVLPCVRLVRRAKKLEQLVILGSYFSHFARTRPEWKMIDRHPYIKSRMLQLEETKNAARSSTKVAVLEIPYVFGTAPGMTPLWKPLIDYVDKTPLVFYTNGGTNICSVEQVARAVIGIIESKDTRDHWIVGGENVSWKTMIGMMAKALDKKRTVVTVPNFMVYLGGWLTKWFFKMRGKSSGLDPYFFMETQTSFTYLDTSESMEQLRYTNVDLQLAIDQTVAACR